MTEDMIDAALHRAVLSDSARATLQPTEEWLRLVEGVAFKAADDGLTVEEIRDQLRQIFGA